MFLKSLFKKPFPFSENPKTAVFVCCHIAGRSADILNVTHDLDGDWQFLCGKTHSASDGRIASLEEVFRLDPTVGKIADLQNGRSAERKTYKAEWVIK